MLKRIALRLATVLAAITIVVGSGLAPAQAASKTITLLDSFDIIDWDPAVIYSAEVRTLLNVYETLTHYNSETGEAEPPLGPVRHAAARDGVASQGPGRAAKESRGVAWTSARRSARSSRSSGMG